MPHYNNITVLSNAVDATTDIINAFISRKLKQLDEEFNNLDPTDPDYCNENIKCLTKQEVFLELKAFLSKMPDVLFKTSIAVDYSVAIFDSIVTDLQFELYRLSDTLENGATYRISYMANDDFFVDFFSKDPDLIKSIAETHANKELLQQSPLTRDMLKYLSALSERVQAYRNSNTQNPQETHEKKESTNDQHAN